VFKAAAASEYPCGSALLGLVATRLLPAGPVLLLLVVRVVSFCRKAATLLLMGRLGGPVPDAVLAAVLVLLLCCWVHC
jgi:hypothetical protein